MLCLQRLREMSMGRERKGGKGEKEMGMEGETEEPNLGPGCFQKQLLGDWADAWSVRCLLHTRAALSLDPQNL